MTAPGHPEDGERGSNAAREGVASRAASRAPSTARAQTRFGAARHSGLGRRTALLAGAGTAAIALTAGTLLYEASGTLEATLAERTAQRARESGTELRVAVATLRDDVQLLASTSFIQGIIRARGAGGIDPQDGVVEEIWRARVGAALARLLEVKPRYTEARLVSRDSADFDTVRVVRDGTRIARAAGDALRAERDDAFLSGVLEGRGGPVALDEVRLARARGQLIHPARAELRAAVPVYDASRAPGERLFGAIVLSLDVGGTLASADRPGAASTLRYAVNDRGDFLLHPEPGHAFAFEMGAPRRIQAELAGSGAAFAALPGTDDLSTFTEDTGSDRATFAFRRVRFDPLRPERFIGLVHALSHDDTAAAAQAWLARSLAVVGVVAAAVMLLVAWLCAAWSRGLVSLAAAVETYAGREAVPLPVDARDETGSIARAFASVVARLAERESRAIESEQRLRGVIETAPDAIVTIDARGIIQAVNPAVERMFQYAPDELRGRNVSCLMPAPFRDEHDGYLARHMATGASGIIGRGRAVEGLRRDGTRIPVFLSVGRFEIAGRALFTGILRDVSEIRATEASLREANADLAAQSVRATDLAALSSAAQESVAPDALARRALGEVLRVTGAVAGAIHLVEETSVRTLASVAFDTSRGPHERFEVRDGLIGQCIAERAAVRVDACPPSYFRIASGLGAHVPHVLLLCPMVRRDAVIAVLELASFDPGHLDTRGYLDAACELLASALGAARLRERESQLLAAAQRQADTLQAQQEELQSTNEELATVNDELQHRMTQLATSNDDLQNLLANLSTVVMLVGSDLKIRRFSTTAGKILNMIPGDIGRSVSYLDSVLRPTQVEQAVSETIHEMTVKEQRVRTAEGTWYTMRTSPYRTAEHAVRGAVIELTRMMPARKGDVPEVSEIEGRVLSALPFALALFDPQLRITYANKRFFEAFQLGAEILGIPLDEVWAEDPEHEAFWQALQGTSATGAAFQDLRVPHPFGRAHLPEVHCAGYRVPAEGDRAALTMLAISEAPPGG